MKIDWQKEFDKNLSIVERLIDVYPWSNARAYGAWLTQTYFLVRHTSRFLALKAARLPFDKDDLHYQLMDHCREEAGHDKIALLDLHRLGFSIDDFSPLAETTALYRAQYFALEYGLPAAHFGYSFCFEGLACRRAGQIQKVVDLAHGSGKSTFLSIHAEVDEKYFASAFRILAELSEVEGQEILENLVLSCLLYEGMMKRLMSECVEPVAPSGGPSQLGGVRAEPLA